MCRRKRKRRPCVVSLGIGVDMDVAFVCGRVDVGIDLVLLSASIGADVRAGVEFLRREHRYRRRHGW